MDAVLADFRTAPIAGHEKALFTFLEKANEASHLLDQADMDAVVAAGWTTDAIYDAITVSALFNFYNKWIDATGVSDMSPAAYEASGERLATLGYLLPETPDT